MKRSFMILLCFSLLSAFSGCKPNPSPVVDAGKTVAQEQPAVTQESAPANVPVSDVGSNQFEGELIEVKPQCPPSYGVTFRLPADWTCEVIQSDDEPTSDLVVSIKPKQANSEGAISISHMTGFGVCGTGLVQKEMEFNGHPARQGFYDGNALWSFIALEDPKDCVIMNSAENWYEEYEEEINQILSTVEFVYYEDHTSVSEPTEPIIDSASFDIDSDGIIEDCTITYGPTSGLFTAVITASVNGDIKYKNTFNLAWGALSFGENSGFPCIVRVRALEGQESKTEYLSLSVQDGRIVIGGLDPELEGYWGDGEWNDDQRDQTTVGDDTLYSYWKTTRVKVYRSVDELAEVSTLIVAGECVSARPVYQTDMIYTLSEIRITDSYKGKISPGSIIQVVEMGGRDSYGEYSKHCFIDEKDFTKLTYPDYFKVVCGADGFWPMKKGEQVLLFLGDTTGFIKDLDGTLYDIIGDYDGKLYLQPDGTYKRPSPSQTDEYVFDPGNLTANIEALAQVR
ncbi:MAG: hypothetical protein IJJ92_06110 [Clostridia bacterium]|nr:hypothetical protein [Clostridia bacterium]